MSIVLHGPFVNMNGASRESLIEQHRAVMEAARELRNALALAAPHGRDYQTNGGQYTFGQDRILWEAHLRAAGAIANDYERIAVRLVTEEE